MKYLLLVLLLLSACDDSGCVVDTDQKLRREIFKECLGSVPAGPQSTVYNDWDELVSECGDQAYRQSLYMRCPEPKMLKVKESE